MSIPHVTHFTPPPAAGSQFAADDICPLEAHAYLRGKVIHTPLRRLQWLERLVGVPVWAKLENQQHTGSFKFRGALYRLRRHHPSQVVVTASAGNHGLAIAHVARRMGLEANICIPVNASRLKRERILAAGAGLLEHGMSLDEATEFARDCAQRRGWTFVSPYNDPEIVAGQSTVGLEMLEDVPALRTLIVPVGGGGLIAGIALGARATGHHISLYGCESATYPSMSQSLVAGRPVRVIHQPTYADGLAVNLDSDARTLPIVRALVQDIITLTEEDLAGAALALLFRESLLVEPAGAAAVAACIRLAKAKALDGPVGIPLCGGNLHHTTLARLQRHPFSSPEWLKLLDLRGHDVVELPIERVFSGVDTLEKSSKTISDEDQPERDDLLRQIHTCIGRLENLGHQLDDFTAFSNVNKLDTPERSVSMLRQQLCSATALLAETTNELTTASAASLHKSLWLGEANLRTGLQVFASARNVLEWRSPAFDQSEIPQFFNLASQHNPSVNYERYESSEVKRIERQLLTCLSLPDNRFAVTVVSSGMSAYALIEAYLLRHQLCAGATVVLSPYIYFEVEEQIASLNGLRVVRALDYDIISLVDSVKQHRPHVLFADPMTNSLEQRMIDVNSLVRCLSNQHQDPIVIVVDGTMLPGVTATSLLQHTSTVSVLYYESCSKYLQLGLDISMAGFVAHRVEQKPLFDRLRRNMGLTLYSPGAFTFPVYEADLLQRRMRRIEGNASHIAIQLNTDPIIRSMGAVIYPGLPTHPDHMLAQQMGHTGGCITFRFHHPGDNHRDQLESFIDAILDEARAAGVQLVKGVSFGFSVPRISAAASLAGQTPAFLRINVGDRPASQVEGLVRVIARAMSRLRSVVNDGRESSDEMQNTG